MRAAARTSRPELVASERIPKLPVPRPTASLRLVRKRAVRTERDAAVRFPSGANSSARETGAIGLGGDGSTLLFSQFSLECNRALEALVGGVIRHSQVTDITRAEH